MKSLIVILFTFFYFFASAGISFNLHYCGGSFKNISLLSANTKSCCDNKKADNGCCHDKTISIKLKEKQEPSHFVKIASIKSIQKCDFTNYLHLYPTYFSYDNKDEIKPNYSPPPTIYKNPLFIMNRVLII
jgi:hypothetical protein